MIFLCSLKCLPPEKTCIWVFVKAVSKIQLILSLLLIPLNLFLGPTYYKKLSMVCLTWDQIRLKSNVVQVLMPSEFFNSGYIIE